MSLRHENVFGELEFSIKAGTENSPAEAGFERSLLARWAIVSVELGSSQAHIAIVGVRATYHAFDTRSDGGGENAPASDVFLLHEE